VDYELAAIQALSVAFQDAVLKGCTFHFQQAVLRRVQQEGLKTQYDDQEDAAVPKWIKRLMSLYVAHFWHQLCMGVAAAAAIDQKCSYRRKTSILLQPYLDHGRISREFVVALRSCRAKNYKPC